MTILLFLYLSFIAMLLFFQIKYFSEIQKGYLLTIKKGDSVVGDIVIKRDGNRIYTKGNGEFTFKDFLFGDIG